MSDDANDFNDGCKKAAAALQNASALLVCTGAGFSADSGLPVYNDIANDPVYKELGLGYAALATPSMLVRDKELFYGFWCNSYNVYQETSPHKGYDILRKWKGMVASSSTSASSEIATSMTEVLSVVFTDVVTGNRIRLSHGGKQHVLTYTVTPHDGSPPRSLLIENVRHDTPRKRLLLDVESESTSKGVNLPRDCEILTLMPKIKRLLDTLEVKNDIKTTAITTDSEEESAKNVKNCFYLATSNVDGHFRRKGFSKKELYEIHGSIDRWQCSKPCTKKVIPMTEGTKFNINNERRMTESSTTATLQCKVCCGPMRPAICMFADSNYIEDVEAEDQFLHWKQSVVRTAERLSSDPKKEFNFVVLEIGAGKNVTTVRNLTRELSKSISSVGGNVTIIRINPVDVGQDKLFKLGRSSSLSDLPSAIGGTETFVPIQSKGLTALTAIDELL